MSEKRVEIVGVGSVLLQRSRRAKRIRISVSGSDSIRVSVPYGESFTRATKFVESKKGWIAKQVAQLQEIRLLDSPAVTDEKSAREKLLERLDILSRRYGLLYNRVFIRNQKTRWASCSEKNNISLNIRMILLPETLIDYVLLHELVHTRIKNHSVRFWDFLESLVRDAKTLDRSLHRFRLS